MSFFSSSGSAAVSSLVEDPEGFDESLLVELAGTDVELLLVVVGLLEVVLSPFP